MQSPVRNLDGPSFDLPIWYLKVNRFDGFGERCFWRWVAVAELAGGTIRVVCDKPEVIARIELRWSAHSNRPMHIVASRRDDVIPLVQPMMPRKKWQFAAAALLTPYLDANDAGCSELWNIDADDSYLYVSTKRIAAALEAAAAHCRNSDMDAISLDFHHSFHSRPERFHHWSFGVVYSPQSFDVRRLLRLARDNYLRWTNAGQVTIRNVDEMFTNLGLDGELKLGTFGIRNAAFRHAEFSGVRWRDDKLELVKISDWYKSYMKLNPQELKQRYINLPASISLVDVGISTMSGGKALLWLDMSQADWAERLGKLKPVIAKNYANVRMWAYRKPCMRNTYQFLRSTAQNVLEHRWEGNRGKAEI